MSPLFRPQRFLIIPTVLLVIAALPIFGCGKSGNGERPPVSIDELESDGHVGHKHAETYPEAVAELEEMNKVIAAAFAAEDLDAAHDPLHEIGHVLDELPGLAKKHGLGDEAVAAISGAVEKLFDAFGKVDEKFHGAEGATYDEVKETVDTNMAILRQHLSSDQ
jgi:hypothetical protein